MRTQLELQRDPMWQTLFHKLTPIERDFIVEISASVRDEAIEDCAKIAEKWGYSQANCGEEGKVFSGLVTVDNRKGNEKIIADAIRKLSK